MVWRCALVTVIVVGLVFVCLVWFAAFPTLFFSDRTFVVQICMQPQRAIIEAFFAYALAHRLSAVVEGAFMRFCQSLRRLGCPQCLRFGQLHALATRYVNGRAFSKHMLHIAFGDGAQRRVTCIKAVGQLKPHMRLGIWAARGIGRAAGFEAYPASA